LHRASASLQRDDAKSAHTMRVSARAVDEEATAVFVS
jgi:hypothetical protein